MKLEQSFEVDAPLEMVWATLIDVQRVAPCLPGAQLTDVDEHGTYHGTFSVKIGPATASYRGTMTMEEVDEAGHKVTMRAHGTDKRGQGGAKALMHSRLTERDGGGTRIEVETDMTITGRLASFSRGGMIQDVSNRLMGDFAACLQASLAHEQQSAPAAEAAVAESAAADPAAPGAAAPETTGPSASALTGGTSQTGGESTYLQTDPGVTAPPAEGAASKGEHHHRPHLPHPHLPHPHFEPAKPINAFKLLWGVLMDRLRRLFGRKPRSGR